MLHSVSTREGLAEIDLRLEQLAAATKGGAAGQLPLLPFDIDKTWGHRGTYSALTNSYDRSFCWIGINNYLANLGCTIFDIRNKRKQ